MISRWFLIERCFIFIRDTDGEIYILYLNVQHGGDLNTFTY